jgi:hypothetical protein
MPVKREIWRRHRRARMAAVRSQVIRRWLARASLVGMLVVLLVIAGVAVYTFMQRSIYPA